MVGPQILLSQQRDLRARDLVGRQNRPRTVAHRPGGASLMPTGHYEKAHPEPVGSDQHRRDPAPPSAAQCRPDQTTDSAVAR